uniref:Uncharacterized protein n=1 Tax=Plectus sambesii TaxID=2011161 RepID=A0A914XFP2_9BILA
MDRRGLVAQLFVVLLLIAVVQPKSVMPNSISDAEIVRFLQAFVRIPPAYEYDRKHRVALEKRARNKNCFFSPLQCVIMNERRSA